MGVLCHRYLYSMKCLRGYEYSFYIYALFYLKFQFLEQYLSSILKKHLVFMKLFLIVISIFISLSAAAQDDSEITWFENLFTVRKIESPQQALKAIEEKQRNAFEMNDPVGEIKAMIESGAFHLVQLNDYDHALDIFIKSLILEDSLNNKSEKIFTFLAMARVFEAVGDYYKSNDLLNQAFDIAKDIKNDQLLIFILNEKGNSNMLQLNLDAAYKDYENMLKQAKQLHIPHREADALFHLGQLMSSRKEYEKAMETCKEALAIRRILKDKTNEAASLNGIAELYRLMKNPQRAIANYEAAISLWEAVKNKAALAESYNHLGELYVEQKNYKKAISYLNRALQKALEGQIKEQIRSSYDLLSLCYSELNDYKSALRYKELQMAIEKFIEAEKNERQLSEMQNRYSISKKETIINRLEADKVKRDQLIAAQDQLRNILLLVISFAVIIALLILYLYVMKQRSNQKLREVNATKDKLFSIIGHDLKGPLNSLSSFVSLLINHIDQLKKEEIRMLSQDLDKSLKNLYALLENLLEWSRSQTGNRDYTPEGFDLHRLVEDNHTLLKSQLQQKGLTLLNQTTEGIRVNAHRNSMNAVVRNLISNAIKFTPTGGTITVSARRHDNLWRIKVADTGVGMSQEIQQKLFNFGNKHTSLGTAQEKGTGLGLVLCKEFVEKNGGQIEVESTEGEGSVFSFTVPAAMLN